MVEPFKRGEVHRAVGAAWSRCNSVWPLIASTETVAPPTGWPVRIDCTKTSRLPSSARLASMPEIGDDDQARIRRRRRCRRMTRSVGASSPSAAAGFLRIRIVGGEMQQEDAPLAFLQVLAEIDAFIVRLARRPGGNGRVLPEALDDMVFAEAAGQLRMAEAAVVEAHQMLQLVGQHAPDFQLHAGHVARHDRDAPVAAQRQQRAVGHEAQQLGIVRHGEGAAHRLAQDIAAEGFEARREAHIDPLPRLGVIFEALQLRDIPVSVGTGSSFSGCDWRSTSSLTSLASHS